MDECGWPPRPDVRSLLSNRARGVISSQIIEDFLRMQKKARQCRGSRVLRKPQNSFWSPTAENIGAPHADTFLLAYCSGRKCFNRLADAGLGVFANARHNIVFRRTTPTDELGWHTGGT